jgi:hypothetical protein
VENASLILNDLIKVLKSNGKKYFIFSLNSLNEFKLGNFPNIHVWVQISCAWTLIRDYKELYHTILSPDELINAFDLDNWDGKCNNDIIKNWKSPEIDDQSGDIEVLVEKSVEEKKPSTALVLKKENLQILSVKELQNTHSSFIESTFKGLDRSIKTNIKKAIKGKEGIAMTYTHEQKDEPRSQPQIVKL